MATKRLRFYTSKEIALSIQHMFAMFGATVLVPIITGLNPAVTLLSAGLGTLVFHFVTKLKVPVFLGSSFAFIPGIVAVVSNYGIEYVSGGIIFAGAVYLIFAVLVYFVGIDRIKKVFPPIVTGPITLLIGLSLAFSAINDAQGTSLVVDNLSAGGTRLLSWGITFATLCITVICLLYGKKLVKIVPILIGLAGGYVLCLILTLAGIKIIDFGAINDFNWVNTPYKNGFLALPKFNIGAILIIAPMAIVTFMEHIGDMTASGKVCGQDFIADPGLHRTLMGDGLATMLAGFLGGPANTTYSENTGVLATTKNYDPRLLRLTAVFAIILAFIGKFSGVLLTIPSPVKGGIEIIIFGMIVGVGFKVIIENKINMLDSRNMVIMGLILIVGVGVTVVTYNDGSVGGIQVGKNFSLSPVFLSTIVGVVANLALVKPKQSAVPLDSNEIQFVGGSTKLQTPTVKNDESTKDYFGAFSNTKDIQQSDADILDSVETDDKKDTDS